MNFYLVVKIEPIKQMVLDNVYKSSCEEKNKNNANSSPKFSILISLPKVMVKISYHRKNKIKELFLKTQRVGATITSKLDA